ncbi:MAG: hypothetical protein IPH53_07520 [Flavobacteriales bacterium]|nr:hypothetical protein [Flavobacteriales bacterium]
MGYVVCGSGGDENAHDVFNDAWAYRPETDNCQPRTLPRCPDVRVSRVPPPAPAHRCRVHCHREFLLGSLELTDAFWEYQPAGLIGLEELPDEKEIHVLVDGDGVLVRWTASLRPEALQLLDMRGRPVHIERLGGGVPRSRFNTADLASGLYVVRVHGSGFGAGKVMLVN